MSKEVSAGLLLTKIKNNRRVYLLAHPGGPFYKNKDEGVWSIPKGLRPEGEDILMTAYREFREEMGAFTPMSEAMRFLGHTRLKSGKEIYAFLVEGDFDPALQKSNTFEVEWPPRSNLYRKFPEVDRCNWFSAAHAKAKLHPAQAVFIDRAEAAVKPTSSESGATN